MTRLASSSLRLKVSAFFSNIDICSTFSTWKRSLFVSSTMIPERCLSIDSLFVTEPSPSICAAREMVEMGVLNSCVMLLIKSFLISVSRFWRNIV